MKHTPPLVRLAAGLLVALVATSCGDSSPTAPITAGGGWISQSLVYRAAPLRDVVQLDAANAVGDGGRTLHTTDGGGD